MSKKKNTLKDLDAFLKQQAATLVTPPRLSEKLDEPAESRPEPVKVQVQKAPEHGTEFAPNLTSDKLLKDLKLLAAQEGENFREKFYDLIIRTLESQHEYSPEDRMLINTALYLKSGENWQEVIREYWKTKT